jgi:hypothetical protein
MLIAIQKWESLRICLRIWGNVQKYFCRDSIIRKRKLLSQNWLISNFNVNCHMNMLIILFSKQPCQKVATGVFLAALQMIWFRFDFDQWNLINMISKSKFFWWFQKRIPHMFRFFITFDTFFYYPLIY